jgi:hypothetical protein
MDLLQSDGGKDIYECWGKDTATRKERIGSDDGLYR